MFLNQLLPINHVKMTVLRVFLRTFSQTSSQKHPYKSNTPFRHKNDYCQYGQTACKELQHTCTFTKQF